MEEKKKKNKGLIVTVIILIVLLLGSLGILYYGYTKYNSLKDDYKEANEEIKEVNKKVDDLNKQLDDVKKANEELKKDAEKSIKGEIEYSLANVKCSNDGNKCTKKVEVVYDGKEHEVKVVLDRSNKYNVYIDNKEVDSGLPGTFNKDFDGIVYIFNNKYVGLLRSVSSTDTGSAGYSLTLYNDGNRVGEETEVKHQGQTLCYDKNCNREVTYYDFDGKNFKYWEQDCSKRVNVRYSLTFDGKKVSKTTIDRTKGLYGGGASAC